MEGNLESAQEIIGQLNLVHPMIDSFDALTIHTGYVIYASAMSTSSCFIGNSSLEL